MFNSGYDLIDLISISVVVLAVLFGLWVWFLVNRANVLTNEQIQLLQEIAEQQRQQTALLKSLVQNAQGEQADGDLSPVLSYKGIVPER